MYILGLSCFRENATAALLNDGAIVGISEEERFVRFKYAVYDVPETCVTSLRGDRPPTDLEISFFPSNSIDWLLGRAGIDLTDVDYIAYDFDHNIRAQAFARYEPISSMASERERQELLSTWRHWRGLLEQLAARCRAELVYVPHHAAHASGSVFSSGFDHTNYLVLDAMGELVTTTYGTFRNGFTDTGVAYLPHSLGFLYAAVTNFLGFNPFADEQKTMGLAAYGEDKFRSQLERMAWVTREGFETEPSLIWTNDVKKGLYRPTRLPDLFRVPPRAPDKDATKGEYPHIACSLQLQLERIVEGLLDGLQETHPAERLCINGGVALNSQLNGRIAQRPDVGDLFVQPQAGDSGTALGAAYFLHFKLTGGRPEPLRHAYWGPEYSDREIEAALQGAKLPYERSSNITAEVADLLHGGKIVGWFQGRSECGPRSLGNRSILADCSIKNMNDTINKEVKDRETWRPFAASVLEEEGAKYVDYGASAPYMLLTLPLTNEGQRDLGSASHVNGTTRLQTVDRNSNPKFFSLLSEFKFRTGRGGLLNTSFNVKGEPIVNTPSEAIKDFYSTGLDALAIGNFLLTKDRG